MRQFIDFLKQHPLAWVLPIVVFGALVVFVAVKSNALPENPMAYSDT